MNVIQKLAVILVLASLALPLFPSYAVESLPLTDLTQDDPFFYTKDQFIANDNPLKQLLGVGRPTTTHSDIPHLPAYYGYMSTNSTYRFININEQVLTMIGEGKHGMWRIQEKGTVREYLRKGATGLPKDVDLFAIKNKKIIDQNYSHYLSEEGWSGYKYPDQAMNEHDDLNFIDLPITHPKYKDKYTQHEPIELPSFYCTMSGPDYVYAKRALDFAFNQTAAGKVGPLGKRAGLDITENYTRVLQLDTFPDARSWVNVGQDGRDANYMKWLAVDSTKTATEYYLLERPFFNRKHIYLTVVFDNKDNTDFQYVRPKGAYFDSLQKRSLPLKTTVTQAPRFHIENDDLQAVQGLPIFGVHYPNMTVYGGGGACPFKGGDYGRYPDTKGGAGWPTQYEEISPLCDGVLVDVKFYRNLDDASWNNPDKYLANAATGSKTITYKLQGGEYGVFTEKYSTQAKLKNPERQNLPNSLSLHFPNVSKPVSYIPTVMGESGDAMLPLAGTSCRSILQS